MIPAITLAAQRWLMSDASRFMRREFSAICCNRQNAKYAHRRPKER
jgi:hypothetical protein